MRNKIWLCLMSIALLLLMLGTWFFLEDSVEEVPFSLQLTIDGGTEIVRCHKVNDGMYYVFLPGGAQLSAACIRLHTGETVSIGSVSLTEGMNCSVFEPDIVYNFLRNDVRSSIMFCSSNGIPALYVDTETGNMDYIHVKKGNRETTSIRLYEPDGRLSYKDTHATLQGRGNFTWTAFDKKPYSLTLSQEASLLGMGAASNWVLLANASDASHIRNKLVYDFAEEIGLAYSPQSTWVELYLNGEYAGLYLLSERNEIHPQRVDLSEHGSFLVSAEFESRLKDQNYPFFATPSGQTFRVQGPQNVQYEEMKKFGDILTSVENAIFSIDRIDCVTKKTLFELIDLESWVKKYLIEEVFCNVDACLISQFYYYDAQKDRVFAGPVWDYDISLGNAIHWVTESPYVFVANQLRTIEKSSTVWFVELYQDPIFYETLVKTYERDVIPRILKLIDGGVDAYFAQIKSGCYRDGLRWGTEVQAEQEIACIKDFLAKRINFLSDAWENKTDYCMIQLFRHDINVYYPVPRGQLTRELPRLPDAENALFLGWYYVGTDEPFDATKPVTEDISLYARWEEYPKDNIKTLLKPAPVIMMALIFFAMLAIECKRVRKMDR